MLVATEGLVFGGLELEAAEVGADDTPDEIVAGHGGQIVWTA